jgi:hypothetical protein
MQFMLCKLQAGNRKEAFHGALCATPSPPPQCFLLQKCVLHRIKCPPPPVRMITSHDMVQLLHDTSAIIPLYTSVFSLITVFLDSLSHSFNITAPVPLPHQQSAQQMYLQQLATAVNQHSVTFMQCISVNWLPT